MMDRGREGRRSSADRGPVSAPRRPRTSGFKDASVGEDCDDTMDDVHSARLRERPKKDSSSLMSGKGFVSSGIVSISRIKRKRQGLHEIQVQVRGSIAAELEDTTHDSEIGGSEDDDDLPPPPIPRRLAKSRPQGKGVEDIGIRNDLPTVPRKARSVPKRVQESPPPPILETPSHPPQLVSSPTPAPSSTLSSSSAVTLKPRRRTKSSGSKPKVSKLLKVSTPTVSEEVEVAEALFDLARMIPPSALDRRMDVKSESKSEVKSLASGSAQTLSPAAQSSYMTASPTLIPAINTTAAVLLGPSPAAASPVPSPSPPSAAAPAPAEAPKRKRPRVRTHPDDGAPQQAGLVKSTASVIPNFPGAAGLQSREVDQSEAHPAIADTGSVKSESTTTAPMSSPSSSPCGAPVLQVQGPSMRQNNMMEKKHDKLEKKIVKGEVTRTTYNEKNSSSAPPLDKKPPPVKFAGPTIGIQDVDATMTSSPLPSDSPTEMDVAKRSAQPAPSSEGGGVSKFDIDLMALPSKAALPLINERNDEVAVVPVEEGQEKPLADVNLMSPVASGWIEREREERQEQEHRETDETPRDMPKEQEREKDRDRMDLSKMPLQWASKGVKPESRSQKSEKASSAVGASVASSLLASTATSPISPGMPVWPGVIPSLGYFPPAAAAAAAAAVAAAWPAASSTGRSSVDENPRPRVFTFSNKPPQQPWKRCASHVWIARFIDTQQQVNRHPFFAAGVYGGKSYNPNMSLPPPEALYRIGAGVSQLAAVAGPPTSSAIALGAGLGVGEQVLGATTTAGAKERERERKAAANFVEPLNQDPAPQQQQPGLSLQAGVAFGFSGTRARTVTMASGVSSAGVVNGVAAAAANMGAPALPGSSSGPGTSSLMAGSLGPAGGPGTMASNWLAVSATSVQEQCLHAMMQNLGFPYHQFPGPHFGHPTFSGPPSHMGTQQAAAQYFGGAPFFGQHLVSPAQHPVHQTSVVESGGPVPLQKQQQQQGVCKFPPTGSPQQPPPQSPSHSSSQQLLQPQSDRDGRDGPSGGDNVAESKLPISHRPPYSQGSPNTSVADVSVPPPSVQALPSQQDFSIFASLGKQSKQREQQQQQQLQDSQPQPSLSSLLQHQQQQAQLQINLKGIDPQATQALSAMTMAAAMNRGPIGPGPLGLAPVAAVMAPQGHVMLQSMADAVHQSPHHSSGGSAPHPSLIHQQQQHQQHPRSVQIQRGLLGVDKGHMVADASSYPSSTVAGQDQDPGEDRKTTSKRPIGSSSSMSPVELDSSPTRGIAQNVAPTLNLTASSSAIMSSCHSGHIAQGGVAPPVAQPRQAPRQSMVCMKGITGPNTASSSASNQSNMVSYIDRGSLASASLTAKVSGPGLSLPGQTPTPASQVARQTSMSQQPQLKLSQRTSMGSMPTAPGTDPKAVLAAAMAKVKSPQSQLQQSCFPQATPHTGPLPRMSSAVSGSPVSSSPTPLSPFPAGSKSSTSVGAKQASSRKGYPSLPTTQKSGASASGKRNSSPSLSSPSLANQSVSAKLPRQQEQQLVAQNSHPLMQQPQVPRQYAESLQQQYPQPSHMRKQQNSQQQQIQMRQQQQQQQMQMFRQQQLSHSHSQPLPSPPPQHVQQYQQQLQHSPPLTQSQLQQSPVQHLNQQRQQQQQQQLPSSLSGSVTNGTMSGPSNSGNIANSGRSSDSENIGGSQVANSRPAPSNLSVSPLSGAGSQKGSSSGASFLHPQFSASQGMTSNIPVMQSIQHNSIAPYPQSAGAVGRGGKPTDMKTSAELNSQDHLNSIRPMQAPASVRTPTSSPAAGHASITQPSPVRQVGAPTQGKLGSGQFVGSKHGDNMVSRSSLMQPGVPSSTDTSPNCATSNNISNGHIGSNVLQSLFVGNSAAAQQGTVNSSQMRPPSSLSMVAASVVPTGPVASSVEP